MLFTRKGKAFFNASFIKIFTFGFCLLVLAACSKDDKQDAGPATSGLTETKLTTSGSAQRVWQLFLLEEKYLNAAGGIDSTIIKGPIFNWQADNHSIRFSTGNDVTTGQTNARLTTLYSDNTLAHVFPGIGNWQLSADAKKITITKHPRFSDGGNGGAFSVEYAENAPLPFPYPLSLGLAITDNLPNGRKVERKIMFGAN